jgi:hypothetical protein
MIQRRSLLQIPFAVIGASAAASVPAPPAAPSPLEITHGLYQEVLAHCAADPTDGIGITNRLATLLQHMLDEYGPKADIIDPEEVEKHVLTKLPKILSLEHLGSVGPAMVPLLVVKNLIGGHLIKISVGTIFSNTEAAKQYSRFIQTYHDKLVIWTPRHRVKRLATAAHGAGHVTGKV